MPVVRRSGREDRDRAWELMGGVPRFGRGAGTWLDAHPVLVGVIGLATVLLVVATVLGFGLVLAASLQPTVTTSSPAVPARP